MKHLLLIVLFISSPIALSATKDDCLCSPKNESSSLLVNPSCDQLYYDCIDETYASGIVAGWDPFLWNLFLMFCYEDFRFCLDLELQSLELGLR